MGKADTERHDPPEFVQDAVASAVSTLGSARSQEKTYGFFKPPLLQVNFGRVFESST